MRKRKIKHIIAVLVISLVVGVISLKTIVYFNKHIKYKKPIKITKTTKKVNTKIKNIKYKPFKKETPSINCLGYTSEFIKTLNYKLWQKTRDEETKKYLQLKEQREQELQKQENNKKPKYITIIATAYTGSVDENGGYNNITASGTKLNRGGNICAVPKDIPFNKTIVIEGLGCFNAEDRGNEKYIKWIDENTLRVDIYVSSKKEALNFGVRKYKGYIQ